jgi:hypothetical protein
MVHVTTPRPNLGAALGQGLGQGVGQHFENIYEDKRKEAEQLRNRNKLQEALGKAQQIYSNPNLSEEEKQFGLYSTMSEHPEIAKQIQSEQLQRQQFNQLKQYQEQKIQQQQQQQEKQQDQENALLRQIEQINGLQPNSLKGFEKQPGLAAKLTAPQAEKQPQGGLTGQPVPAEVSQKINDILNSNPEANSDQLRVKMDEAGIPPTYSNPYTENRRRQDEIKSNVKEKRVEAGNKRAEKILEDADKIRATIPQKRTSLMAMEDAVEEGDMSFFSLDNLAEMTGVEGFRTAKGGQFKTASKNFFINTLQKTGARPNMFLEKQIADGLPKIGRSKEGNLIGVELAKFDIDYEAKRLEMIDEISDQYMDSLGYVPGTFGRDIDKSMKTWVEERQEQLAGRLKSLNEQEISKKKIQGPKQSIRMTTPEGGFIEVPEDEVEEALKLGAKKS